MLTDMYTNPDPVTDPNEPLPQPFDQLVTDQTLTEAQARAVMTALAGVAKPVPTPSVSAAGSKPPRAGLAARLAEIGAYLGAALVVAAGIVVVAQQWSDMTYAIRVAVMGGTTLVLLLAAGGLVLTTRGRPWDDVPNGDTLRRLSGTLFSFGALGAFGTVMVALLSHQDVATDDEVSRAFVLAALVAAAVLVVARLRADTPIGEIGLMAASVTAVAGLIQLTVPDETMVIQWTLLAVGLTWALVGTYTQLMRCHVLVTSLGLLVALFAATIAEEVWSQRLALATLIVVSLAVYLARPLWPYIAAATVAAVVLTVTWVGEAVGAAVALLAAGLVFLVLAGGALVLHRRRTAERGAVAPVP
jgi:hypothetical protein